MRPRPEVVAITVDDSISDALEAVRSSPYSRFPVVDQSIDDIVGFVHVRDLFELPDRTLEVRRVVRPIPFIPSTARILPTLTNLRASGDHIAVVFDEYGGTDGIVTLEDLVEEVVGEIFDEYDTETAFVEMMEQGGAVDGRLNFQDFEEATGVTLPAAASDTVAGFVVERLGRLAVVGDRIDVDGGVLQVAAMDRRRISELHFTPTTVLETD